MSQIDQNSVSLSTKSLIIDALLDIWTETPADQLSVRRVVQKAGTAQASIHYHFGDLERLYLAASDAALHKARAWMDAQQALFNGLEGGALPAALQASAIASIIAEWTGNQRRLAMAWRYAPSAAWQMTWEGFWTGLAALLGLGAQKQALSCFAAGEAARHLLVWQPALDRALLEETCRAFVIWLREARLAPDEVRPAYQSLVRSAYRAPVMPHDRLAAPIAHAAATLLAEQGHAGVTFRAVASKAGVTMGKVVHLYPSKSKLLHAALHSLYDREALGGDHLRFIARSVAPDAVLAALLEAVIGGNHPVLVAYDEIERAIYNGAEHSAERGLMRAMEDPSAAWALQQLLGRPAPSASLVAAFSAVIRGIGYRAINANCDPDELHSQALMAMRPFLHGTH